MDTNQAAWMRDAVECLKEYYKYGEEMRKIGRGFHPTGIMGHSIESVIAGLEETLQKHDVADRLAEMDAFTRD